MKNKCLSCRTEIEQFKLGSTPIAGYRCDSVEESLSQPSFPLSLQFCPKCNFVNYRFVEEAETILDKLYSDHFSTFHLATDLSEYLENFVNKIISKYQINEDCNILEIGCNDGKVIKTFQNKTKCKAFGVEPSKNFNSIWGESDIEIINEYFDGNTVKKLSPYVFKLVFFRHVYEHIPNPIDFIENISKLLNNDSILIIEVPYFITVLNRNRIENMGYSHLNYYTIRSINDILNKNNLGILWYELVETDGGSIVFHIKKNYITNNIILDKLTSVDINSFLKSIEFKRNEIEKTLIQYNRNEIIGYGAGAKGQHLVHLFQLQKYLDIVIDDTPEFKNKYIPGTGIKILLPTDINWDHIKAVINLVPTHPKTIKEKIPQSISFIDFIN